MTLYIDTWFSVVWESPSTDNDRYAVAVRSCVISVFQVDMRICKTKTCISRPSLRFRRNNFLCETDTFSIVEVADILEDFTL